MLWRQAGAVTAAGTAISGIRPQTRASRYAAIMTADPGNDGVFPGADDVTPAAVIAEVDRPVAGLSRWIAGAHAAAAATGRTLCLLTSSTTRITYPLELLLTGSGAARWIVRTDTGSYHDGLSGQRLRWDGQRFTAPTDDETAMDDAGGDGDAGTLAALPPRQLYGHGSLRVDITGIHPAAGPIEIGETVAVAATAVTGAGPAGWGAGEPVTEPWSPPDLTAFARDRAPRPTSVVVTAGTQAAPVAGTVQAEPAVDGVHVRVRLAFGTDRGPGPWSSADLDVLAQALAEGGQGRAMLAAWQPGRSDTTREAGRQPSGVPVGLFAGHEIVSARGVDHARAAPAEATVIVGSGSRSGCWCRFGTATPHQDLIEVMNHFRKW
jgi:hypothetical protein